MIMFKDTFEGYISSWRSNVLPHVYIVRTCDGVHVMYNTEKAVEFIVDQLR